MSDPQPPFDPTAAARQVGEWKDWQDWTRDVQEGRTPGPTFGGALWLISVIVLFAGMLLAGSPGWLIVAALLAYVMGSIAVGLSRMYERERRQQRERDAHSKELRKQWVHKWRLELANGQPADPPYVHLGELKGGSGRTFYVGPRGERRFTLLEVCALADDQKDGVMVVEPRPGD